MRYNVAQLLKEPIGATRDYPLEEHSSGDARVMSHASGELRLLRTHQGILATASVSAEVPITCSRCLRPATLPLDIEIEEEFFPRIDIITGHREQAPEGVEDPSFLDTSHTLDMTDVLRQQVLADLPLKPLCHPDCRGLCQECGADLNQGKCDCAGAPLDPRWGALAALLRQE